MVYPHNSPSKSSLLQVAINEIKERGCEIEAFFFCAKTILASHKPSNVAQKSTSSLAHDALQKLAEELTEEQKQSNPAFRSARAVLLELRTHELKDTLYKLPVNLHPQKEHRVKLLLNDIVRQNSANQAKQFRRYKSKRERL